MSMISKLLMSAAVLTTVSATQSAAEDCVLIGGLLPEGCTLDGAGMVIKMPAGANRAASSPQAGPEGFLISIGGQAVAGDTSVSTITQKADRALADADVRVTFDGLGANPRLDVTLIDAPAHPNAGDILRAQSRLNYPAFVTRGEFLVLDRAAAGGLRTVLTVPVAPNSVADFALPAGDNLVLVHRVYDAQGRYDETGQISLNQTNDRGLADEVAEGIDNTARHRIPVNGGAITVFGTGVAAGAKVQALDATITPDPDGSFVLQRILPSGDTVVGVQINGAGAPVYLERAVTIPGQEWFYVATADLTFGRRTNGAVADADPYFAYGRLSGYAKGKTVNGWTITANIDTTEEDLRDIFRNLDEKDPYSALRRMNEDLGYQTYGDDSTIADGAPSRGRFYLRAENEGSHVMWGNYKSTVGGSHFLRNERALYGAQGVYVSPDQTSHGESKVRLEAYAAQPDQLPGREVFVGTGGSAYFLQRQDIGLGSETVTVEVRDATTNVLVRTTTLVEGRDYDINYLQGLVILSEPLSSTAGGGTVITDASGENTVNLVVQYEYTPVTGDVSGLSYGGRAETWVGDALRIGATGLVEQTEAADQTAVGVDARYRISDQSYFDVEFARTRGKGFGSSLSSDGGLIITNTDATGGDGTARRVSGQLDLTELGSPTAGTFSFYGEQRTAGFSTLDYQILNDEDTYGFALAMQPSDRLSWRVYFESFQDNAVIPKRDREGGVEVTYVANDAVTLDFGLEHLERAGDLTETGKRTDAALRATFTQSDALDWYVFGQGTLERTGTLDENNRYGVGFDAALNDATRLSGEVSDGSQGAGGRIMLNHKRDDRTTSYVGYELLPERDLNGVTLQGRDAGRIVAGGTRALSDTADVFAENTYDLFGQHRSLTSTYGVNYRPNKALSYSSSIEIGKIQDPAGDFDRQALSFGVRYLEEHGLSAKGRLELRKDEGVLAGSARDATTVLFTAAGTYKIDETQRLVFSLDYADTDTESVSVRSGEYVGAGLGYALRPVDNDKFNMLFSYLYLRDMYGQTIDGTDTLGPRQESHVLSVDASYDINEHWTLGGKIGGRVSKTSPSSAIAFSQNDAFLGVANARYHLTHQWDLLLEGRYFVAKQAGLDEFGLVAAGYRHLGNNLKIGIGHNFGRFSDDLTDMTYDDQGTFFNLIAKF